MKKILSERVLSLQIILEHSWGHLERCNGIFGPFWSPPRGSFGDLGGFLGWIWSLFGGSWGLLGQSWGLLGRSPGGMLAHLDFWIILGLISERFGGRKGCPRRSKMESKMEQKLNIIVIDKKKAFKSLLDPSWAYFGPLWGRSGSQKSLIFIVFIRVSWKSRFWKR